MRRKIWQGIYALVGQWTPERMQWLRNVLVRNYVRQAGKSISIGRWAQVHKNTVIGEGSGVGRGCFLDNGVTIGAYVMMGPEVLIYTRNHNTGDPSVPMLQQGMGEWKPVVIEDDVWIGARCCILPGVTIGKGSVLGACTVVAKDVPPYSVVVGNPGRVVKNRKAQDRTETEA